MSAGSYSVAIFIGGICRRTVSQIETQERAAAIATGVRIGVSLRGATADAYVLPGDGEQMREEQRAEEVSKMR